MKGKRNDLVLFMSTETGKKVITEDVVLDFHHAMLRDLAQAKVLLTSFEYAVLHNWTIQTSNGPYSGRFVDCAKQAERYELRRFLAALNPCWKREKLPETAATDGLVSIIEKLAMNMPEFFVVVGHDLDALQLTQSKAQLQTRVTEAQESKYNEKHQAPSSSFNF